MDIDPDKIAEAVGEAVKVKSHLGKDYTDQCGYCGQHFPPDEVVIEREILGRKWSFCSEECLNDFREHSDFKDQNLDGEPEISVNIKNAQ